MMGFLRNRSGLMVLGIACALVLAASGCHRRPTPPPTPEELAVQEQRLMTELNQTLLAADEDFANNQSGKAMARVEAAFHDTRFAAYRSQIFESQLRLMLRGGDDRGARQLALSRCGDPELAMAGCGLLYRFDHARNDLTNAAAWSASVLAQTNLFREVRRVASSWSIDDNMALSNDDAVLAVLQQVMTALTPTEGVNLWTHAFDGYFAAGRPDSVARMLALAGTLQPPCAALTPLATVVQVHLQACRADWDALTLSFATAVGTLPDAELDRLMRTVFPLIQKADKRALIDQCAETVVAAAAAHTNTLPAAVGTAARALVENVMETDKGAFPKRLDALLRDHVPVHLIVDFYTRYFYTFTESPAVLKQLLPIGERLIPLADDEELRTEIKTKLLDACFLLHDYDQALIMLESGIPGRDASWLQTAIVKVKAHRALEHQEPREAVKYFRAFMDLIRASKDTEVPDPVTNIVFPREMILGRNAKRIGDILAGIPDADEAAKAYAEARGLYAEAMDKTHDADARKVIEGEIAQLPK